jgi:DNA-binding Lrp family transcriptional regulator
MARRSQEQIKKDEKKLIGELQKNARMSIDEIAQTCGFSRQKVWRMMKRLEEEKNIWGYHSVVDTAKLGRNRYILLIRRSTEPVDDAIRKIVDLTVHKKGEDIGVEIEGSSYIHGRFDWIMVFTAENIKVAKQFSMILEKEYHSVISEVHLLEELFPVSKCGLVNPNKDKITEFI